MIKQAIFFIGMSFWVVQEVHPSFQEFFFHGKGREKKEGKIQERKIERKTEKINKRKKREQHGEKKKENE